MPIASVDFPYQLHNLLQLDRDTSLIKFIDANWSLKPIDGFSRDNLHNPTVSARNPYVPTNMPAIDDLMDYFRFETKAGQ